MPRIDIQLVANTSAAMGAISQAFAGIEKQSAVINSMGAAMRGMSDTFFKLSSAAAGLFSVGIFKGFIDESLNSRRAVAQLEEAMKSAGVASKDFSAELEAQRTAMERSTAVDDDVIAGVQRFLVAFGVGRDKMAEYTLNILDYAAAMEKGTLEAAQLFAKGIAGDTIQMKGFNVEIDQSLPKLEKVAMLMAAMASKFRGQAVAKSDASGGMDALSIAINDIKKDIGGIAIDSGAIQGLADMARYIAESSKGWKEVAVYAGMASVAMVTLPAIAGAVTASYSMLTATIVAMIGMQTMAVYTILKGVGDYALAAGTIALSVTTWAALAATIWIAVEAYRAWGAQKQEASAKAALAARDIDMSKALLAEIEKRVKAGTMENDQALLMLRQINSALALRKQGVMTEDMFHNRMVMITAEMVKQGQLTKQEIDYQKTLELSASERLAGVKGVSDLKSAQLNSAEALLKQEYDRGLITEQSYYDAKKLIIKKEWENQRNIISAEMRKINEEIAAAELDPNTDSKKQGDAIAKMNAQKIELATKIKIGDETNLQKRIALEDQQFAKQVERDKRVIEIENQSIEKQAERNRLSLEFGLQKLNLESQLNNADFTKSAAQRQEDEKTNLQQQIALYDEKIARLRELQSLARNEDTFNRIGGDINSAQSQRDGASGMLEVKKNQADLTSFSDQIKSQAQGMVDAWGTSAQQMAGLITGTVTSAVQGLSNAMANVIMGTQSAAQAFGQFALQMATSFVASVVQMILIATVAIPILTALGILSGGGTVSAGLAVVGVASAAAPAMSSSFLGRAEGGMIPGAASDRDNRMAMVATGEYVARSRAVGYYGAAMFEALNSMRIPREKLFDALNGISMPNPSQSYRTAYADGGMVGPGRGGDTNVSVQPAAMNVAVLTSRSEFDDWAKSSGGTKTLINIWNKNKHALGIRS